jgi:hypothetical protein
MVYGGSLIKNRIFNQDEIELPNIFNDDSTINIEKWYSYVNQLTSENVDLVIDKIIYYLDPYTNTENGKFLVDKNNVLITGKNNNVAKSILKINENYQIIQIFESNYDNDLNIYFPDALYNILTNVTSLYPKNYLSKNNSILAKLLMTNITTPYYLNFMTKYAIDNNNMKIFLDIFFGFGGNLTYRINAANLMVESNNINLLIELIRENKLLIEEFTSNGIDNQIVEDYFLKQKSIPILKKELINTLISNIVKKIEYDKENILNVYSILKNRQALNDLIYITSGYLYQNILNNLVVENNNIKNQLKYVKEIVHKIVEHNENFNNYTLNNTVDQYNIENVMDQIIKLFNIIKKQLKMKLDETNDTDKVLEHYMRILRNKNRMVNDVNLTTVMNIVIVYIGMSIFSHLKNLFYGFFRDDELIDNKFTQIYQILNKNTKIVHSDVERTLDNCVELMYYFGKGIDSFYVLLDQCNNCIKIVKDTDTNIKIIFDTTNGKISMDGISKQEIINQIIGACKDSNYPSDKIFMILSNNAAFGHPLNYYYQKNKIVEGYKEKVQHINLSILENRNEEYYSIVAMIFKIVFNANLVNLDNKLFYDVEYDVNRNYMICNADHGELILLTYINKLFQSKLILTSVKSSLNSLLQADLYLNNDNSHKPINLFDYGYLEKNVSINKEYFKSMSNNEKIRSLLEHFIHYSVLEYSKYSGYPDCVETTVRNFINVLMYKNNFLDVEQIKRLSVNHNIVLYYQKYNYQSQKNKNAYIEWNDLIHDIFNKHWTNPNNKLKKRLIYNIAGDVKSDFINFFLFLVVLFDEKIFQNVILTDGITVEELKNIMQSIFDNENCSIDFRGDNNDLTIVNYDTICEENVIVDAYDIPYIFEIVYGHSSIAITSTINNSDLMKLIKFFRLKLVKRWNSYENIKYLRDAGSDPTNLDLIKIMVEPEKINEIIANPYGKNIFSNINSEIDDEYIFLIIMIIMAANVADNTNTAESILTKKNDYTSIFYRYVNIVFKYRYIHDDQGNIVKDANGFNLRNKDGIFKDLVRKFIAESRNKSMLYDLCAAVYLLTGKIPLKFEDYADNNDAYRSLLYNSIPHMIYDGFLFNLKNKESFVDYCLQKRTDNANHIYYLIAKQMENDVSKLTNYMYLDKIDNFPKEKIHYQSHNYSSKKNKIGIFNVFDLLDTLQVSFDLDQLYALSLISNSLSHDYIGLSHNYISIKYYSASKKITIDSSNIINKIINCKIFFAVFLEYIQEKHYASDNFEKVILYIVNNKSNLLNFIVNNTDNIETLFVVLSFIHTVYDVKIDLEYLIECFDQIYEQQIKFDILFYTYKYRNLVNNYFAKNSDSSYGKKISPLIGKLRFEIDNPDDKYVQDVVSTHIILLSYMEKNRQNKIRFFSNDLTLIKDVLIHYDQNHNILSDVNCQPCNSYVCDLYLSAINFYYIPLLNELHDDISSRIYKKRSFGQNFLFKYFSKISYITGYDGNKETLSIVLILYLIYLEIDRSIIFKVIDAIQQNIMGYTLPANIKVVLDGYMKEVHSLIMVDVTGLVRRLRDYKGIFYDKLVENNMVYEVIKLINLNSTARYRHCYLSNQQYGGKYYKYKLKYAILKNQLRNNN